MSKSRAFGLVVLIVLVVQIALMFTAGTSAQPTQGSPGTVVVAGEAEIRVVPDQVILRLGVETNHRTLADARRQNDEAVAKLLVLAQRHGVARKDVQTDHISVEPRYRSPQYDERILIGYTVRNNISYLLRDVSRFDGLLAEALTSGANVVHGIQFRCSELRKYRDQARELAMKAAREKAEALAGAAGQKVLRPISIQDHTAGVWPGTRYSAQTQNVVQNAQQGDAGSDELLAAGVIPVTARVGVTYEMR